jgi:hypothetical protein
MLLKHFMIICIFVTGVRGMMMMMMRRMTMKFRRNQRSREEHLKNTLNRPNPVETGFEKERGWNPLGITKQEERETTLDHLGVALGRRLEKSGEEE